MPYWQLFYHIVWATKGREPVITGDKEAFIHNAILGKASALGGKVFAIGGVEDHVHLVVSIPPSIAVATFIGQVKGASSAIVNKGALFPFLFRWQSEYGVFTFDRKRLPYVKQYVKEQKERHQTGRLIRTLERFVSREGEHYLGEEVGAYVADMAAWEAEWGEM